MNCRNIDVIKENFDHFLNDLISEHRHPAPMGLEYTVASFIASDSLRVDLKFNPRGYQLTGGESGLLTSVITKRILRWADDQQLNPISANLDEEGGSYFVEFRLMSLKKLKHDNLTIENPLLKDHRGQ